MLISLDGYFEGPNHSLDWHHVDEEFNDFAIEQLHHTDTLVFGRVTYDLMASFWPTKEAIQTDPVVADLMNSTPKYVFSKTLQEATWNNTTLVNEHAADKILELKKQNGKDIGILGSNNLTVHLLEQNAIDEFRILVNPVALGKGSLLFAGISKPYDLTLLTSRQFSSGNMLLTYAHTK